MTDVYTYLNTGLYEMPDLTGLDYESAAEAMPRLYMVNIGNGNDGVGTSWPRFYVKTCDPFTLAAAAIISQFDAGEGQEWAMGATEVSGEADYTVSATIYDPPDDREDYEAELANAQQAVDNAEDDDELEDAQDTLTEIESSDPGYWSESNGAWRIIEVSLAEGGKPHTRAPVYTSLRDAFSGEIIALAMLA